MSFSNSSEILSETEEKSRIRNFTFVVDGSFYLNAKKGDKKDSSTLNCGIKDQIKCNLEFYPNSYLEKNIEYSSIYLNIEKSDKLSMTVEVEFYILNEYGLKENIKMTKGIHKLSTVGRFGIDNFVDRGIYFKKIFKNLSSSSQRKTLTLGCDILLIYDNKYHSKTTKSEEYSTNLVNDVSKMLESTHLSDCIIKVADKDINVHKFMLASRSDIFLSIFNNKDGETESNVVKINDFRLEVVKEMITYMYTETSPNLSKMTSELLSIATKYNLMGLKSMAEECLCNTINIENACDYLEMSELYAAKLLKESCISFICENALDVIESKNWKTIVTKYPLLLEEIFISLIRADRSGTN